MRRCRALLPLLLLVACGDPAEPPVATTLDPLFGTWEFLRACGGVGYHCIEGTGDGWLTFAPPDSMIAHTSDSTLLAHRARLAKQSDSRYVARASIEVYDDQTGEWRTLYAIGRLSADSLTLYDNFADGFTHYFERVPPGSARGQAAAP